MDRCALFVDAGYVLADGAMAVHGTRRRESVTWDHAGLLQLLAGLATQASGLPLLRCYWYEATVEGRRSPEHDELADLPGVKLRLAKMRPGRREGVESEIHRDLATLARNRAISEAMIVSAEEDLAEVIADVQDLGLRVTMAHITVDGNWTISRALRQECDDVAEVGAADLAPYVELISGAEPAEEPQHAPAVLRPVPNGHAPALASVAADSSSGGRLPSFTPAPAPAANGSNGNGYSVPPPPPYAPALADFHRGGLPQRAAAPGPAGPPAPPAQPGPSGQPAQLQPAPGQPAQLQPVPGAPLAPPAGVPEVSSAPPAAEPPAAAVKPLPAPQPAPQPIALPARTPAASGQAPAAQPPAAQPPAEEPDSRYPAQPAAGAPPYAGFPGYQGQPAGFSYPPPSYSGPHPVMDSGQHSIPGVSGQHSSPPGGGQHSVAAASGQHPVPVSGPYALPGQPPAPPLGPPGAELARVEVPVASGVAVAGAELATVAAVPAAAVTGSFAPGQPAQQAGSASLADAVKSAHGEGLEFGGTVAREAPALWLDAVLARKPRMPSDLEARLLQGSSLPIDYLLHDDVRNALRRGFWDALERGRR